MEQGDGATGVVINLSHLMPRVKNPIKGQFIRNCGCQPQCRGIAKSRDSIAVFPAHSVNMEPAPKQSPMTIAVKDADDAIIPADKFGPQCVHRY